MERMKMEILVQKNLSEPSSKKIFAQISTEVLTLEDVVHSLSGIIDDEALGYHKLPFMSARSESLQRLDVYTSLRKRRADKAFIVSNGKNTIYMLDYVVKAQKVYHDPVLCIIGPDAEKIGKFTLKRLSRLLLSKMYRIGFNDEAIRDFSNLTGDRKSRVITQLSDTFEEAELEVRMKLLNDPMDERESSAPRSGLSKEIINDMRKKLFSAEPIDPRSIIPFGIMAALMILLLIVLTKL